MTDRRKFIKQALAPAGALYLGAVLPVAALAETGGTKEVTAGGERAGLVGEGMRETKGKETMDESERTSTPERIRPSLLSQKLKAVTRATVWKPLEPIKVQFKTFHCQGMVKIGNDFWVSSVEIEMQAGGAFDWRKGKGHLFKIDATGNLLADIAIGEGTIYHPSGIDFDGKYIWIAAAEYRPDSQAIIYRFDPGAMKLQELFRWQDHIGGILRNPDTNTLYGISWGSRRFYQWRLDEDGGVLLPRGIGPSGKPASGTAMDLARLNTSFYIDYQDNQAIGGKEILYTGLSVYKKTDGTKMAIGGLEIVDVEKQLPVHQVPVDLWSPVTGAPITQNPSFFELAEDKIRAYFMPDDNESTIYIYEL